MSTRTLESHICLSLVLLLGACGDGTSQTTASAASAGTAETGDTGDASAGGSAEGASACMCGDASGDADAGSTDPTGDADAGDADADAGDADGDAGDADADADAGDGDPGDGDPGDGDGDPGDGDGDGGAGFCGDGIVNAGEECDDGLQDNGPFFACKGDCMINVCGDGADGPDEGCDDGNLIDGDGCSAVCTFENLHPDAVLCGDNLWKCGDGIDNDMDGLVDLHDPECTTHCDDDEAKFYTSLPGQNLDCKADCYFDENSGMGNDTCEYEIACDPADPGENTGCSYNPNAMCNAWGADGDDPPEQSQQCQNVCVPLTPDGCDCFGCCVLDNPNNPNEPYTVYLGNGDCDLATIGECPTCTPNPSCFDPCGDEECEVCFAKTVDSLDDSCVGP